MLPVYTNQIYIVSSLNIHKEEKDVIQDAPRARQQRHIHPDGRPDEFDWMKDKNFELISYLSLWNAYTLQKETALKKTAQNLLHELTDRVGSVLDSNFETVGEFEYFTRYSSDSDYPLYLRKKIGQSEEELLIDMNSQVRTPYFMIKSARPSLDGRYMAFMIDTDGTQFGEIKILDLESKKWTQETIKSCDEKFIWSKDSLSLYYLQINDLFRTCKLKAHKINTDPDIDNLLYEEMNPQHDLSLIDDPWKHEIFLTSASKESTEIWQIVDLDLKIIRKREQGRYEVLFNGPYSSYLVSYQGGLNGALYKSKDLNHWELIRQAQPDTDIDEVSFFQDKILLLKRVNGNIEIEIIGHGTIPLPSPYCEISFCPGDTLKFLYSSPLSPPSVYEYDISTRKLILLRQIKIKNFDPSQFTVERIEAKSLDGVSIPITLIKSKKLTRNGESPCVLYGYGSYGAPINPSFSLRNILLLERGVSYAIAHCRGGGDLGRSWYHAGRLENKMNTFNDFIACAKKLIKEGYTSPKRLAIEGASAGGLLVAASMNSHPELFKAVVCEVPFVDVITTMMNPNTPYTQQDWLEWGNPANSKIHSLMSQYDPYTNVRTQKYPALRVLSGVKDAQVPFHEAAKWVSRLVQYNLSDEPIYFKIYMQSGHLGDPGREAQEKDKAETLAFLLDQLLPKK